MNKIIQGDCLEKLKELKDDSINLVVTSPPYNMRTRIRNGQYTTKEKSEHFSKKYDFFSDDLPIEEFYLFHKNVIKELLRVSEIVFYNISIVTGSKEAFFKIIGDYSKEIKDIIVWDKGYGQPAMHSGVLNRATELIIIFEKNAKAGRCFKTSYFKRGTMDDIWRIKRPKRIKKHRATFPEELAEKIILNWSKENDIILDPFAGTGTTLKMAKKNNRQYLGIEISPEYIEIIKQKLQE